jgi:hypothetical protein
VGQAKARATKWSSSPSDIDILIIYDEADCSPALAYGMHEDFIQQIKIVTGLRVHLTLLTKKEEQEGGFIVRFRAMRFDALLSRPLVLAGKSLPSVADSQ